MDQHTLEKLEFDKIKAVLARYAATDLGRKLIERLLPTHRQQLVRLWLAETEQMVAAVDRFGPAPFAGARDVTELIRKVQPGVYLTGEEFYLVGRVLQATHYVHNYLKQLPDELDHLHRLAERMGDFQAIAWRIDQTVDAAGRVRDTAGERLMKIRAKIEDSRQKIRKVLDRLIKTPAVVKILRYPNWTFQGDRMVLPVSANHRHQLSGIVHRSSDSGATLFIEPTESVELNNAVVKLGLEEQQEIARILWELAHLIHLNRDEILIALKALARLDMLGAKAAYAIKRQCVKPRINGDRIVSIQKIKHPLLMELLGPEKVVPINVRVGDDFDLLIITGPNTGGKTVTLKTIGLAVLMTQAGMFIPAHDATLPVFDDVFIDVGDEQSLQQSLSTFSSHLTRILEILRKATPACLALIDELGAGTDPDEGAAIGQAVLDQLLRRQTRTIVTTHLSPLKSYAYRRPRTDNAAVEFDPETLSATYKLRIGEPGNSNAMIIAEHLGMPKHMLKRARRYISGRVRAFQQAIDATVSSRREAEQARSSAMSAEKNAEQKQKELEHQINQLHQQQQEFERWLAWINSLKSGEKVYVKKFRREGTVVRMELHKQQALVDLGRLAAEVPLTDIDPVESVEADAE